LFYRFSFKFLNKISLFSKNISLNLKNESTVEMQLVDVSGKVIAAKNYGSLNGTWSVNLNTSNLKAGMYLVELTLNGTKVTKRLIVE
jgi:hypothetical protein